MRTFSMPFPTTRGALERTLQSLGFVPTHGNNDFGFPYVEYRHKAAGSVVSLRVTTPEQPLTPSDLLIAEHAVEWFGVTSAETFYRLLKENTTGGVAAA